MCFSYLLKTTMKVFCYSSPIFNHTLTYTLRKFKGKGKGKSKVEVRSRTDHEGPERE